MKPWLQADGSDFLSFPDPPGALGIERAHAFLDPIRLQSASASAS
jgi:hypothetical protein